MARREWGTGSCYPLGRNTYRVSISLGADPFGKRKRKEWQWTGPNAKTRAEAKLREVQRRLDRGLPIEESHMTLAGYVPEWLSAVEHTVKPATFAEYRSIAEVHLAEGELADYRLTRIGPSDVRSLLASRLRDGYATRTVRGILDKLRMLLRQAKADGLVERNVAEDVKPPRLVQAEPQHFTVKHARRFLDAAKGDALFSLYATALGTGLRRGELLALTHGDVSAGVLTVQRGKTRAASRKVPLPAFVQQALSERLADGGRKVGPLWPVSPSLREEDDDAAARAPAGDRGFLSKLRTGGLHLPRCRVPPAGREPTSLDSTRSTAEDCMSFYDDIWDGTDDERRLDALDLARATTDVGALRIALRMALNRLSAYQLECRHLADDYLAKGMDPRGFCRGTIFEHTFADITAALRGGPER